MAGLESNNNNEPKQQQQQKLQVFGAGTEVEVRSDEEGFKGAWFRAIIVTSPTNSASKKRKRALVEVEYKTLVTEDGSQQLKEYVDLGLLRPVPPQLGDKNFEEGDVVDADYRDGWWTGVVRKVLDNNSKYKIFFENPPDLIEFGKDRLRPHQDWVSGQWVRPNKQEELSASDPPQDLEHVLHAENNSNHLEVDTQVENSGGAEDNPELIISEKNFMDKPSYPRSIKEKKMLARNVSATNSGPVKKLKDDKATEASNKEKLHESATGSRGVRGTRRSRKPPVRHQLYKTESLLGENNVKAKLEKRNEVDSQWVHPVTTKGRRTKSQVGSRLTEAGKEEYAGSSSAPKFIQKEGASKETEVASSTGLKAAKGKEGSMAENSCQLPDEDLPMRDQKKNLNDPAQEKSKELKQQPAGGSSNKRKRGRPRKLVVVSPQAPEGVKGQNGAGNFADGNLAKDQTLEEVALHVLRGMDTADSQDASRRKTAEFPGTRCMTNEARPSVGASDNTDDDDRPLSMWFGGIQCPANVVESRPSPDRDVDQNSDKREPVEIARESPAVDAVNGCGPDEKRGLPFVKSSPVWKTIEAFEVFKVIPQNPHFLPLGTCKEAYREGIAIGNMVTFSSLAEQIKRLKFEDPRDVFESILESLLELEKYGFNVTVLRGRVNDLLSIKDRQGRFQVNSKDAECKIVEHSHMKTKLVEEADCIAKKIIELQEKRASLKAEMEAKEIEIASLQIQVGAMNERMQSARSDFEKLVSAVLK